MSRESISITKEGLASWALLAAYYQQMHGLSAGQMCRTEIPRVKSEDDDKTNIQTYCYLLRAWEDFPSPAFRWPSPKNARGIGGVVTIPGSELPDLVTREPQKAIVVSEPEIEALLAGEYYLFNPIAVKQELRRLLPEPAKSDETIDLAAINPSHPLSEAIETRRKAAGHSYAEVCEFCKLDQPQDVRNLRFFVATGGYLTNPTQFYRIGLLLPKYLAASQTANDIIEAQHELMKLQQKRLWKENKTD